MDENVNPYAAPETPLDPTRVDARDGTAAEQIRRQHLSHEASIRSIGFLYILSGIAGVVALVSLVAAVIAAPARNSLVIGPMEAVIILVLILQLFVGRGLRQLRSWSRLPAILISMTGIVAFPIGTIISLYFLYLLASRKGGFILSPEYRRIVAETPHVKYRSSLLLFFLLTILIAFLIAAGLSLTL